MKRIISMLLAVVLVVAMLPMQVAAQEVETLPLEPAQVQTEDAAALHAAYIEQQMRDFGVSPYYNDYGDSQIEDENTRAMYRDLKAAVKEIADEGGSAVVTLDLRERPIPKNTNFNHIIQYLLNDCPYETYWYDKTSSNSKVSGVPSGDTYVKLIFTLQVIAEYQVENYDIENPVVKATEMSGSDVAKARENALALVAANEGKSDLEKLTAYKDYIRTETDYNWDALNSGKIYGSEWQLVWVFDENPETMVICEGYSKAFQYLCELTEFEDPDFESYIITGNTEQVGGSSGGHMWNQVTLNDVNYLVDVTNVDTVIGDNTNSYMIDIVTNALFMNETPDAGSNDGNGYSVTLGFGDQTMTLIYTFFEDTKALYPAEILKLGQRVHTYTEGACEVCGKADPDYIPEILYGDVNGDAKIDSKDLALMIQYFAGMDVEIDENAANVKADDKVDSKDLALMIQYFAGMSVELGK